MIQYSKIFMRIIKVLNEKHGVFFFICSVDAIISSKT